MAKKGSTAPKKTPAGKVLHDDLAEPDVVSLTDRNKRYLLRDAIQPSADTIIEAQDILARLQEFDPSVARDFVLKHNAISRAPLRLLCTQRGKSYDSQAQVFETFIALSYCWHSNDWKPTRVCRKAPRSKWPISVKMLQVLLGLQKSEHEGIWIDALCINQCDELEKRHAIGLMDVIYKSARLVVIVLEDIWLSDQEIQPLQDVIDNDNDDWSPPKEYLPILADILIRLLSARWFTRAWCSHELQLSNEHLILVPAGEGILELNVDTIEDLYYFVKEFISSNPSLDDSFAETSSRFDTVTRSSLPPTQYVIRPGYVRPLMSTFYDLFKLNSSIVADKVGIAINVGGLAILYTGTEKSADQCRWILSVLALSAGDATAICGVSDSIQLNPELGTISWLRWEDGIEYDEVPELPKQSHIANVNWEYITLDFLCPVKPLLNRPTSYAISKAKRFMDQCLASQDFLQGLGHYWSMVPGSDVYLDSRKSYEEILACSLDCGQAWMVANGAHSGVLESTIPEKVENEQLYLRPAVINHLIDGLSAEGQDILKDDDRIRSILYYVYWILQSDTLLESVYGHTDGDGQITDFTGSGTLPSFAWIDMNAAGRGIIMIPRNWRALRNKLSRIAIPAGLNGSKCAPLRRLWFLERLGRGVDSSWRVLAKFRLLTCLPILEDKVNVHLLRDQCIYG